jgi:hypothetical protein
MSQPPNLADTPAARALRVLRWKRRRLPPPDTYLLQRYGEALAARPGYHWNRHRRIEERIRWIRCHYLNDTTINEFHGAEVWGHRRYSDDGIPF